MDDARFELLSFGEAGTEVRDPAPRNGLSEITLGPRDPEIGCSGTVAIADDGESPVAALALPCSRSAIQLWQLGYWLAAGSICSGRRRAAILWRRSKEFLGSSFGGERLRLALYKPIAVLNPTNGPRTEAAALNAYAEDDRSVTAVGYRVNRSTFRRHPQEAAVLWTYRVNPDNAGDTCTTLLDLGSLIEDRHWSLVRATECERSDGAIVVCGVATYRKKARPFRAVLAEIREPRTKGG